MRQVGILRERAPDFARFWSRAERIDVPSGTVLLHEGSPGDALLFVYEGSVEVRIHSDGGSLTVARLPAPVLLGVTGAVDGELRTSTCIAETPTSALRMRRGVFLDAARQATPEAELVRELLLITMHRQLLAATARLRANL